MNIFQHVFLMKAASPFRAFQGCAYYPRGSNLSPVLRQLGSLGQAAASQTGLAALDTGGSLRAFQMILAKPIHGAFSIHISAGLRAL